MPDKMRIEVAPNQEVTALVYTAGKPDLACVTVILGHGAGADQSSDFMTRFATGLAARGINVDTFNFLYTEQGRRVPDANKSLEVCFRAVIEAVRDKKIGCGRLVIGGKSLGGRIVSQVAAASADGEGLVFLGYPLHPPGRADPSCEAFAGYHGSDVVRYGWSPIQFANDRRSHSSIRSSPALYASSWVTPARFKTLKEWFPPSTT
jgi:predicted alpha/beta-hydrolase family hydrolase